MKLIEVLNDEEKKLAIKSTDVILKEFKIDVIDGIVNMNDLKSSNNNNNNNRIEVRIEFFSSSTSSNIHYFNIRLTIQMGILKDCFNQINYPVGLITQN